MFGIARITGTTNTLPRVKQNTFTETPPRQGPIGERHLPGKERQYRNENIYDRILVEQKKQHLKECSNLNCVSGYRCIF